MMNTDKIKKIYWQPLLLLLVCVILVRTGIVDKYQGFFTGFCISMSIVAALLYVRRQRTKSNDEEQTQK